MQETLLQGLTSNFLRMLGDFTPGSPGEYLNSIQKVDVLWVDFK